jgi:glycosyltransferase involved in cell wall biosynthesis
MRPATILHIITRLDVGGSTENTLLSVTRMPREAFASSLVAGRTVDPPAGMAEELCRAQVPWVQLTRLRRPVHPLLDCLALRDLTRAIRSIQPDLVHTHSSKAGFLGRLAARRAGVPHTVHTPHGHVFHGYFARAATRLFIALERIAAPWTDRIITLSRAEAQDHLRHGIGRPEQYVTIPSGVDLTAVRAARPTPLISGRPVVAAVARLVPVKGFQYLIDAAPEVLRRCPRARFLIVGDGELRQGLERRVRAAAMADRITFAGFREDVASVMAATDLVVLPSINEGMGRVLVMAMALGKPIVATHVGGVAELLGEGEAGVLVPARDAGALAQAISTLLLDGARAQSLGAAGRRRAPCYSAEAMLEALARLYRDVLAHGPRWRA